jgi:hypothetical protein
MANYAILDDDNLVIDVITGKDEYNSISDMSMEEWYSSLLGKKVLRTSYNGNIRKNFAGKGYFYNEEIDAFILPKPFESWLLDEDAGCWIPPKKMPSDEKYYLWNEESLNWDGFVENE